MSWLAPKLRHKIQLLKGIQTPNAIGGFDLTFQLLTRIWAQTKVFFEDSSTGGIAIVRGVGISDLETHEFKVRYSAVIGITERGLTDAFSPSEFSSYASAGLSKEFDKSFDSQFDSVIDMDPVKSDYFIFLESGTRTKGRLFRINRIVRDENFKEYLKIKCYLIDERGVGYAS